MKESIHAFEQIVKEMGKEQIPVNIVFTTLLDTLAEMAVNIEEQQSKIARLEQSLEVLSKGGKIVGGQHGSGSSGPFSIG